MLGEQRLLDVISAAGGFTDKAGQSITVTHRNQPDKPVTVPLARNATDNPESNIAVSPGDTILVHKADVVYVVGEVGRPSGFLMDSGHLTVLQAIALAGGTTRTAKLSGARILRKGPKGMTETPVELKKDAGSQGAGHADAGGRHSVCPQQRRESCCRPHHGCCHPGCQRAQHRGSPLRPLLASVG